MAQDGKGHDGCRGREEDLLRKGVVRAGEQPSNEPTVAKTMEKGLCSLQMGVALGTAELWVSQTHWKCGSEQAVHRGHLGTSAETQLQCPLKSHPNTSTCVLRHLMEQPKVRESWEGTSCHKTTLQHCRSPQCFLGSLLVPSLCRDIHHPEDRPVTPHLLSLPNTLQMANNGAARQKLVLPTSKASTTALWKPCLPSAGDVFCQCTDTKQRGKNFFPLIPWDPFLPQGGAERKDECQDTAVQEQGNHTHTQLPERLCSDCS